jgi:formamidopyrimidine-DNA glycosylase
VPELPDITVYIDALSATIVGQTLERIRIAKPFLLRSVDPPITAAQGKQVNGTRRMGKRIVLELEDDLFLVIHLMIAGRLRWVPAGGKVPGKIGLAAFDFPNGTLVLTEAGSKRRASLWLVRGEASLEQFERGGLEVLNSTVDDFTERLTRENHTLKRSLTDPRLFSGIGNA